MRDHPTEPVIKVGGTALAPDGSFVQWYREKTTGRVWKCTTNVGLQTVWECTDEIKGRPQPAR